MVTLHEGGHAFDIGDVNHDNDVNINDVTDLIAYVLGNPTTICPDCADVYPDGQVNINDVTQLIAVVLGIR